MKTDFYTLGVYGLTSEQFFAKILEHKIDTFIDIRRRRAVRGSEYTFVNSNRLQTKLKELEINYIHIPDLSPTDEIRSIQKIYDKSNKTTIRNRDELDPVFIKEYTKSVLDKFNFDDLFASMSELRTKRALFFCVESKASACHRSLVTAKLEKEYSVKVVHL